MKKQINFDKEAFESEVPKQARDLLNFTEQPVIGITIMNARFDSNAQALNPNKFYWVGKHPQTGQLGIFPSKRNQKEDFINEELKRTSQLN